MTDVLMWCINALIFGLLFAQWRHIGGLREHYFLVVLLILLSGRVNLFLFRQSTSYRSDCLKQFRWLRGMLCPDCHESLADMPEGRCERCGYEFTAESLKRDWADIEAVLPQTTKGGSRKEAAHARLHKTTPLMSIAHEVGAAPVLVVFILLLAAEELLSGLGLRFGPVMGVGKYVLLLAVLGAGYYWLRNKRLRFYEKLRQEKFLICPDCGYSLVAHADGGRCPECAYVFTPESLVADWSDVEAVAWGVDPEDSERDQKLAQKRDARLFSGDSESGPPLLLLGLFLILIVVPIALHLSVPPLYFGVLVAGGLAVWLIWGFRRRRRSAPRSGAPHQEDL